MGVRPINRSLGCALLLALVLSAIFLASSRGAGGANAPVPDPALAEWPGWPYRASCGFMSFDLVDVFSGPAAAERGKGGPERSLRKMLARGFPLSQPRHGWRLAARRPAKALFIRGRLGAEFETPGFLEDIELERRGGRWQMSTAGDCHLAMVERGQFASGWSLAPRQPDLGPDTQSLWLITGARCSRKQKAPRFEPEFIEIGGRLVLTLWPHYEPEEGGGVVEACDPRVPPWPPVKIELPEPLGERGLYDGAFFPPLPADHYEPPRVIPL